VHPDLPFNLPGDLVLMLLADARLPVAGHTQSGTVEAALQDGLGPAEVPAYLRTRLRTVTAVEAATAVVSRHLALQGAPARRWLALEHAWEARSPSPALREASRRQARALLRLATRTWPDAPALARVVDLGTPSRALALGALGAHLGLEARTVAHLVGYDDVQTVCAASLKLAPLDPAAVVGWVVEALPHVAAMTTGVAGLTDPDDLPATGNPLIEAWAQAHAATTRRLFHA
jgi:urease accessory protein